MTTSQQPPDQTPPKRAIQDDYPDDVAHCYGCGSLNEVGHQIKTFRDGDETVTRYTPEPHHTALPGYVYGGLIASLIDCHGTGTAAAAGGALDAGRELSEEPPGPEELPRFVTARLEVNYRKPTPLGPELEIRGRVREASPKKVITDITLSAEGQVTAEGTVIAVRMPEGLLRPR
jgi:acyl-coenzyme A thioesterase PaaI-like protein